jgi:hypothetical protein
MAAVVEDLLRLAWQANADGRPGMRDALLTLVVAESGPDEAVMAERCRRLLIAHRPDHCFAASTTLGQALSRPRAAGALTTLRRMYPPVRVRHLLLRGAAARGPFALHELPLSRVLEDLLLDRSIAPAAASARDRRRESETGRALPFPAAAGAPARRSIDLPGLDLEIPTDDRVAVFYVSVLLALAVLLDNVLRPSSPAESGTKAA